MSDLLRQWQHEAKTRLPELLDEVANSIKSVYPDCTVILFGSYAREEQDEDSDLDICVLVPELTHNRANMRIAARCAYVMIFRFPLTYYCILTMNLRKAQKKGQGCNIK